MLRKNCNNRDLKRYYNEFTLNNVINSEVHPWIAESWRYSKEKNISNKNFFLQENVLLPSKILEYPLHKTIVEYVKNFYCSAQKTFAEYELSIILTDNKKDILKIYSNNSLAIASLDRFCGVRCSEDVIGTSSLEIVARYGVPFMIFGPEMWQTELQSNDFISIPIFLDKKLLYILTLTFATGRKEFKYIDLILKNMKYSVEEYLKLIVRNQAMDDVLNEIDATAYYIEPSSTVEHSNRIGKKMLGSKDKLSEVYVNYRYLQITEGFKGKKTVNEERVWLTNSKIYNELTTILPVRLPNIDEIFRVISFSIPINKLRELNARSSNYDYRKSLERIPIKNSKFLKIRDKAIALSKKTNTVLLESEAGNALSRFAYGMHQLSIYATGHFMVFDNSLEESNRYQSVHEKLLKKLELVSKGTLFIKDVEKYTVSEGDCIADTLKDYVVDQGRFRIIAGTSSNLKVLTTKGLFSQKLYNILKKNVLKIPPLRERPEDIEILAESLVNELSDKLGLQPRKRLSPEAMKLIKEYFWPGNIMEMVLVLEIAFFRTEGNIICVENIEFPKKFSYNKDWKRNKQAFIETWKLSGGKITNMASMLGVSRITLYRYLHKFNLLEREES